MWRKNRYKLFVYGTLKKGMCNHHYLKNAKFLGKAVTKAPFPMIAPMKWYPYLLDQQGKGYRVEGELYEVDEETLAKIDELEEYPSYYTRRWIDVEDESGRSHRALAYFLAEPIQWREEELLKEFEPQKG